jgi:recombination protein RecT
MSTEIKQATQSGDLKALINSDTMRDQFARALPKHLPPDRFCRVAITALTRTPDLMNCTPASLMRCLLELSSLGIEPDGRRAHLIPYRNNRAGTTDCQLIIDYKGLIELVRRSGDVTAIRAETVCENDEFGWQDGKVSHAINWRAARGAVQAVYAEASLASGEKQVAVMTRDEVEQIRAKSRAGTSGPWVSDWAEMAKKTAVRRLVKMLPLSAEIIRQVEADDDQFSERQFRNVTPAPTVPAFIAAPEPAIEEPQPEDQAQ